MKKLILLFILISGFAFGQKEKKIKGEYSIKLVSVDAKIKNGTIDSEINSYKDSIISITWNYLESQISFKLKNETNETIKVNWNDAVIIDIEGKTKKIFHKDIKYIDREKEQSPTSIYKGAILSDLLSPIENVYFASGKYGGWTTTPIIRFKKNFWNEQIYDTEIVGKKIRTALPLIIDDKTVEYLFEFEIVFKENKK